METVLVRFARTDPESGLNSGEIGGFSPNLAADKVRRGLAQYLDRPLVAVPEPEEGPRFGDILAPGEVPPAPTPTPLPEDFPGRGALVALGLLTVEALPRTEAALIDLKGIGPVLAKKILAALEG